MPWFPIEFPIEYGHRIVRKQKRKQRRIKPTNWRDMVYPNLNYLSMDTPYSKPERYGYRH